MSEVVGTGPSCTTHEKAATSCRSANLADKLQSIACRIVSVALSWANHKAELNIRFKKRPGILWQIESATDFEEAYFHIVSYIRKCGGYGQVTNFYIRYYDSEKNIETLAEDVVITRIPDKAPELWPGKRKTNEELPSFVLRVWGKYIPAGLTLADIRRKDPRLISAINYHKSCKLPWPKALDIPTQRSDLAAAAAQFDRGDIYKLSASQLYAVARKKQRGEQTRNHPPIGQPARPARLREPG